MEIHRHITRWFQAYIRSRPFLLYTENEVLAFAPYIVSLSPTQWPCVADVQDARVHVLWPTRVLAPNSSTATLPLQDLAKSE